MKIKFFVVDDSFLDLSNFDSLRRKFASAERATQEVLSVFVFNPCWSVATSFDASKLEKGGDGHWRLTDDFSKHLASENDFLNESFRRNYRDYCKNGFYRLKYERKPTVVVKNEGGTALEQIEVLYSAQVYIQFVTAKLIVKPEIKKPGEPYQPASQSVEIESETEWMPVYETCGRENKRYGISDKLDDWFRSQPLIIQKSIFIYQKEIEIVE